MLVSIPLFELTILGRFWGGCRQNPGSCHRRSHIPRAGRCAPTRVAEAMLKDIVNYPFGGGMSSITSGSGGPPSTYIYRRIVSGHFEIRQERRPRTVSFYVPLSKRTQSRGFRRSGHAGLKLVLARTDPMQARSMRLQPRFGGRHVFREASHGLPERRGMIHVQEVSDLMRR
jgi:hypothetical protein